MASTYLRKTFSTTGDRQKFSLSMWVKRAKLGETYLWGINNGTNPYTQILFTDIDRIYINDFVCC